MLNHARRIRSLAADGHNSLKRTPRANGLPATRTAPAPAAVREHVILRLWAIARESDQRLHVSLGCQRERGIASDTKRSSP